MVPFAQQQQQQQQQQQVAPLVAESKVSKKAAETMQCLSNQSNAPRHNHHVM
jgi:hypothetical protein